jgi:hypothetical protein
MDNKDFVCEVVNDEGEEGILYKFNTSSLNMKNWTTKGPFYCVEPNKKDVENEVVCKDFVVHDTGIPNEYKDGKGKIWRCKA